MAMSTAEAITTLQSDFETMQKSLNDKLNEQKDQLSKFGETKESLGAEIAKLSKTWDQITEDMKKVQADVLGLQKRDSRGGGLMLGGTETKVHSLGASLVNSQQFKSMVDQKSVKCSGVQLASFGGKIPNANPAVKRALRKFWHRKDEELTSTELGALIDHFRWDNLIQQPLRPVRLMDLMTMIPTSRPTINYPEETVTIALYTELTVASVAASPTVTVANTRGFRAGQTVMLAGASTVTRVIDTGGVDHAAGTLTFTANVGEIIAVGGGVWADDYNFTPEGKYKPAGRLEYTNRNVNVKTLATWMPFSKQMLDDFTGLQALIDSRMEEMMNISLERQVLYGNNGEDEIQGILTHPSIQSYLWSSGSIGDTKLDAIRRSITQVGLSFFTADTVVVHDSDWEDVELAKGEDGHYVFFQVQTGPGVTRVWRANVVPTTAIDSGTALTGSMSQGAAIWDRQEIEISVSDQNRDWWERNLLGIRIEQRKAQSIFRPTAFSEVTFDSEPT